MANVVISKLIELQKRIVKTARGKSGEERVSLRDQEKYINKIKEPKSLFDRSYYQYKCQKKRNSSFTYCIVMSFANVGAFFCLIYFLFKKNKETAAQNRSNSIAVFLPDASIMDRIPKSLQDEFEEIVVGEDFGFSIGSAERNLIISLWRSRPLSFVFVLKCALKIGYYCDAIDRTNASAVITTSEDSYTSSVLTAYCHIRNVAHINMMHGEILYNLARTFFAFDRCYVWDDYYVSLLSDLRAEKKQFIVEVPEKLKYSNAYPISKSITYYLQAQSKEQMKAVRNLLINTNEDYKVRPHRIWTDMVSLNEVFDKKEIEDCEEVSIEESIMSTKYLVSVCSTTLFQGYVNGKIAIVDDLSNPLMFEDLLKSRYIMLAKERGRRLSDYMGRKRFL